MATRLRNCDETIVKVVTLCVHAGIAAADIICCKSLGHFVQGDDHLLEQRKRAWRRASNLVEAARAS